MRNILILTGHCLCDPGQSAGHCRAIASYVTVLLLEMRCTTRCSKSRKKVKNLGKSWDGSRDQNHTRIRRGYAGIRGKYANRYSCPKFSMPSIREFAGQYQRLSKFTQIFTNTRIGYSPIRGHTRTFAQVHRDVSAYGLGHVSPLHPLYLGLCTRRFAPPWAPMSRRLVASAAAAG